MEVVTLAHELNIGTINGKTTDELTDYMIAKMVENKVGIAGSSGGNYGPGGLTDYSGIIDGAIVLGSTVMMGGYQWIVCHLDSAGGIFYLIKATVDEETVFGSNTSYYGSTIANKCTTFYNSLPSNVQDVLLTVGVFGVQGKVFVPKASWIAEAVDGTSTVTQDSVGMFSYFNSNSARIGYNSSGSSQTWWTSSANSSSRMWIVNRDGSLGSNPSSATTLFRPCVALKL